MSITHRRLVISLVGCASQTYSISCHSTLSSFACTSENLCASNLRGHGSSVAAIKQPCKRIPERSSSRQGKGVRCMPCEVTRLPERRAARYEIRVTKHRMPAWVKDPPYMATRLLFTWQEPYMDDPGPEHSMVSRPTHRRTTRCLRTSRRSVDRWQSPHSSQLR
jgi:hypothetical protein